MNRKFSKPIRTYERKKCQNSAIEVKNSCIQPIIIVSDVSKKNRGSVVKRLSGNQKQEANDNSMYYDPLDTTFDRLAKNARIPPPVPKIYSDGISYSSVNTSSTINVSNSTIEPIDLNPFNEEKPILKKKKKKKGGKPKLQVIRGKITNIFNNTNSYSSANTSSSINIGKSKREAINLEASNGEKIVLKKKRSRKSKVQVKKDRIKKELVMSHNSGTFKVKRNTHKKHELYRTRGNRKSTFKHSNFNSLKNKHSENDNSKIKNYNKTPIKNYDENYFPQKSEKGTSSINEKSRIDVEMKPCSVVLDRFNTLECNNEINVVKQSMLESTSEHSNPEVNLTNNCFVKIEQLDVVSNKKSFNISKKFENIFSSTPNSRRIKSAHLITLSPIPPGRSKDVNDSKIPIAVSSVNINKENLLPNEFNQINAYSREESNVLRRNILKRKSDSSLISSTNVSNLNKCNVKLPRISLAMINPATNKTNEIDIPKKPAILVSEAVPSKTGKKKQPLNISADENRSNSLFDSTSKDGTQSIYTNNILIDKRSHEEDCTPVKLDKEQISNISSINEGIICNKIKEEPSSLVLSSKAMILDSSSGGVQIKSKTESNTDYNNRNIENTIELIDSSSNKNDASSTKDSPVINDGEYSIPDCYVVLKHLQNSIGITERRKRSCRLRNLDTPSTQNEYTNRTKSRTEEILPQNIEQPKQSTLLRKVFSPLENIIEESVNNGFVEINRPIYLKPGKSWARSLSILNNVQDTSNIRKLSIGKGRRWSHSVQDVLNMQKQGIVKSCIKRNSSKKELQVCHEVINESESELANSKGRTSDSANLVRLSRRISVRVVPIHTTVKFIEDSPFLEVYGILPLKDQRSTLFNTCEKPSLCNIQSDDINGQCVKEHAISTAREVILQRCSQKDYIPFSTYFSDSYLEHCRKIGEGVYGEVFLYDHEDERSVVKIIPIEGSEHINGEPQKRFHEILSEIVIAMELHNLRFNETYNTDGFVEVKNIKCIKGKYPEKLVKLWNIYDEEKQSDNDCPSLFNDDQLYIVLELGHGGQDLEAFVFHTASAAYTLFIQAALALAVAEKAIEFEHRDLHWGNVLISSTNDKHVHYKLGQKDIKLTSNGVKVSIIDFTLSRVRYQGCAVFNDLALDPTLFTAQGEYQFEIYRLMRDRVKNDWQTFEPYTNILWLHYTLDKMITAVRYRKKNLKTHKNGILKLKKLKDEILTYNSAFDFVTNCNEITNLMYNDSVTELD